MKWKQYYNQIKTLEGFTDISKKLAKDFYRKGYTIQMVRTMVKEQKDKDISYKKQLDKTKQKVDKILKNHGS